MKNWFLEKETVFQTRLNGYLETLNQPHDQCGQVTDFEAVSFQEDNDDNRVCSQFLKIRKKSNDSSERTIGTLM